MSTAAGLATYLRILRYGPASRPFAAAVIARLPYAMAPLGLVVLIQDIRGAYGIAGIITGAYALGSAIGSPLWGRCLDKFGQRRVVVPTTVTSAAMLAAVALAAVAGAGDAVLLTLASTAGFAFPPISPAMRVAWRATFVDDATRRAGYALDASAIELVFVGGPLLLSVLLLVAPPVVPLLVTAALLAIGGLGYAASGAAGRCGPSAYGAAGTATRPRPAGSAVSAIGVVPVLVVGVGMSVAFGHTDTSLAATASEVLGSPSYVGLLFAAIAGGSTAGGLWYGARRWRGAERRRLPVGLGVFAVALAPVPVLLAAGRPPLWALLALLLIAGLAIGPSLIMQQNLLDILAPAHRVNEAQGLLSAATMSGGAAGIAIAGIVIDAGGVSLAFIGAVLALVAATVVALVSQRSWQRADGSVPSGEVLAERVA